MSGSVVCVVATLLLFVSNNGAFASATEESLEELDTPACSLYRQAVDCGDGVCRMGVCGQCFTDDECKLTDPNYRCYSGACGHKHLLPMNTADIVSTVLMVVIIAAAAAGGIGGGGALIPLYVLVAGFRASAAVPLAKATIFGGAVANLLSNFSKRHPTADRPLIDYHVTTLFLPMLLLGSTIGVLANKIIPSVVLLVVLVFVLVWLTYLMVVKGMAIFASESQAMNSREENCPLISSEDPEKRIAGYQSKHSKELQDILDEEKHAPWRHMFFLLVVWIFVVLVSLLKGGDDAGLVGAPCASTIYWILFFLPFPAITILVVYVARDILLLQHKKEELGFQFQEGDVMWNEKNIILYPFYMLVIGICSGLLGVGTGTMAGPLMLLLGMNPTVISATTAYILLFTSSSTTIQFVTFGLLEPAYGLWLSIFGFVGSLIGQSVMAYLLKKYRRQSLVVFAISAILALSTVLLAIQGVQKIVTDVKMSIPLFTIRHLCGVPLDS